jgi:hypothetical protein
MIETFKRSCDIVLQREFAGYRFIGHSISPIINQREGSEVQSALDTTDAFTALRGCNIHLKAALRYLSARENPDYRNSIKESISAIESITKIISGGSNDTMGAALDEIKGPIKLHQFMAIQVIAAEYVMH